MTVYHAEFIGRTKGAIGIQYAIRHLTAGNDEEAARLKLYDWFENVHNLRLTPLVLRYHVVTENGSSFYPSQGRYTWETIAEVERAIEAIRTNNSDEMIRAHFGDPAKLHAAGIWCWPGHFDPAVAEGWPDFEGVGLDK